MGIHLGHFFENVANAFVGSGQGGALGQGGEGAHSGQPGTDLTPTCEIRTGQYRRNICKRMPLGLQQSNDALLKKEFQLWTKLILRSNQPIHESSMPKFDQLPNIDLQ